MHSWTEGMTHCTQVGKLTRQHALLQGSQSDIQIEATTSDAQLMLLWHVNARQWHKHSSQ